MEAIPNNENKAAEFIKDSWSGVLSSSGSREENFSKIVFLALILSIITIDLI